MKQNKKPSDIQRVEFKKGKFPYVHLGEFLICLGEFYLISLWRSYLILSYPIHY